MRLLYDLQAAQPLSGRYHGAATYTRALFARLVELRRDEEISVYYDTSRWLAPDLRTLIRECAVPSIHVERKRELQGILRARRYDRLYSALPYHLYDLDLRAVEVAMTIHGLRVLDLPTDRYEIKYADGVRRWVKVRVKQATLPLYVRRHKERFRRLINNNAKETTIFVPSWHTKHALLTHFPELTDNRVHVFYSPRRELVEAAEVSSNVEQRASVLEAFGVRPRGFFLLVNAGRWVKNAIRALQALDALFTDRPGIDKTVLVLGVNERQSLERYVGNLKRFQFHGHVPWPTLEVLYGEAFALIYPSLNEGFGYPPIESMKFGTPVICSANTSLPEVCGDAALYFNPLSSDEIRNRLSYLSLEKGTWDRYSRLATVRWHHISSMQTKMLDELCAMILGRGTPPVFDRQ